MTLCDLTNDMTIGKSIYTEFYDLLLVHDIGLLCFSRYSQILLGHTVCPAFIWLKMSKL